MTDAAAITLILGGARSGKSAYAEQLATSMGEAVLYVATAQAWDDEMRERIALHRAERPAGWRTLEASLGVGQAVLDLLADGDRPDVILVDCLTMLANNVAMALPEPIEQAAADAALNAEIDGLIAAAARSQVPWIVVSNEVGLGIVPAYALGRVYRDALGRANQRLAAVAAQVRFVVAGLPMTLKG